MKVDSKQPRHSSKKIQNTSRSSDKESSGRQAASTLRTASMQILSVLDPRVQKVAASVVVARRPTSIKKKLRFEIPKSLKMRRTKPLTDEEIEQLDKAISQLEGEAKRDETLKAKREAADQS